MLSGQFEPQILRVAYANGCKLVGWLRRLYTSGCPVGAIVCTVCSVCPVACCLLHGEVHLVCVWPSGLLVFLWSTGLHYKPAYNGFSVVYVFYIIGGLVYWSALLTGVHLVAHIRSAAAQLECLAPPVKGGTQGLGND